MAALGDSDVETVQVEESTPKSAKRGRPSSARRPGPKSKTAKKDVAKKSSKVTKSRKAVSEGMRKTNRATAGKPMDRYEAPSILPLNPTGSRGGGRGGKSYIVEKVLDKKTVKGQTKYLLKWKGYSRSEATWETSENGNFDKLIEKYEAENPSDDEDDDQDWEVEKILEKRTRGRNTEYLLKWKNFPQKDATWEPAQGGNFKDLIKKFEEEQKEDEEYDVEKILEKRTRNGKTEYLLKWKGYSVNDATWGTADEGNFKDLIKDFEAEQRNARADKGSPASPAKKATKRKSGSVKNGATPAKKGKKASKAKPKSKKGRKGRPAKKAGKKQEKSEDEENQEEQQDESEAVDEEAGSDTE